MKTIQELNNKNVPVVRIDDSLEQYKSKPNFEEKLEKANEILKLVGLPKTSGK